jgi:hypothetical protein
LLRTANLLRSRAALRASSPIYIVEQRTLRHCEERKRRSNPDSAEDLDCFASLAMTERKRRKRNAGRCSVS